MEVHYGTNNNIALAAFKFRLSDSDNTQYSSDFTIFGRAQKV